MSDRISITKRMEVKDGIQGYNVSLHWKGGQHLDACPSSQHAPLCIASAAETASGAFPAWSAEHLLITAVGSCFMSTFIKEAKHAALLFLSFECSLFGCVVHEGRQDMVGDIILKPAVLVTLSHDVPKTLEILSASAAKTIIAHSIRTRIHLAPKVVVQGAQTTKQ